MNYYNENDPKTAAWLQQLIIEGLIPNGIVDTRSITEVTPGDLRGHPQCHFFAGIGGWTLALQLAGWPADRPVWTGSCPCQPFSVAGKGKGKEDERHLWPVFYALIESCRPPVVFGEQVASSDVIGKVGGGHREEDGPVWLDGVSADLESSGYTTGACVLGAHSVSSPHIRQRLYWVANANHKHKSATRDAARLADIGGSCGFNRLADAASGGGVHPRLCRIRERLNLHIMPSYCIPSAPDRAAASKR